jgi:hypothetical protein
MFGPTLVVDRLNPSRCQIWPGFDRSELKTVVRDERTKTIQFSVPLATAEIEDLERIVFTRRRDITLRVYGHYGSTCDLSFLEKIPSVERLSADCLMRAVRVETITTLESLKELTVGISDLESFDFLGGVPSTLTKLGLHRTVSKKPSLALVKRFRDLKNLYLEGQWKGIEAVSELQDLETVVLRSISSPDVSYLSHLKKLWSVDIKLGGIKNFDALTTLPELKYLELWQVRGLSDLSFISKIASLQNLFLQSLRQVVRLPNFENSYMLRRISLENMKGLEDLSSLEFAPSLIEFCNVLAGNQKVENVLPVLRNSNVRKVLCGFGSDKNDKLFSEMMETHEKERYWYSKFA